jgi:hypothetical protein
MLTDKL